MKKAIFIILILATAQTARADYHYASHQGSNTYPYTSWATAADSIKYAIAAADPGDTVYIGAGEYFERVQIAYEDSNLAIIGAGIDSTYWWWDVFSYYTLRCADNTIVENIHFSHTITGCIASGNGNSIIVRNCLFTTASGIYKSYGGAILIESCIFDSVRTAVTISVCERAEVRNCLVDGASSAFFSFVADTSIIENNILIDVDLYGVWFPEYASNIESTLVRNNLFYNRTPMIGDCANCANVVNNTFDNHLRDHDWAAIALWEPPSSMNFKNNSISRMNAAFRLYQNYSWTIQASYFNLWDVDSLGIASNPPVTWDTVGIQWADPMYAGIEDFHLQAYSPLIDAGDPAIIDVDGTRSDIGAYGGPGGCSYTYLDLAPLIPDSISATVDSNMIILIWRYNTEADFNRYQIYRDTIPGFEPSIFDIIAEPDTSYYEDTDILPGTPYYYRLTSVDNQGNISDYSEEIAVLPTSAWDIIEAELPYEPRITSAYPNPFNSNIVIVYSASNLGPQPPHVTLKVYDIRGRVVRTLVDDRIPMGTYRAVWDGTNDDGEPVASGTYIARVSQWGCPGGDFPVKITLIK